MSIGPFTNMLTRRLANRENGLEEAISIDFRQSLLAHGEAEVKRVEFQPVKCTIAVALSKQGYVSAH